MFVGNNIGKYSKSWCDYKGMGVNFPKVQLARHLFGGNFREALYSLRIPALVVPLSVWSNTRSP